MQVVLMGMPDSGIAQVAEILKVMGLSNASTSMDFITNPAHPERQNELDELEINNAVFQSLDADLYRIGSFDLAKLSVNDKAQFQEDASTLIQRMKGHKTWMLTDPRLNFLLPLWKPLLDNPVCVFIDRHPVRIAKRLQIQKGFSYAFSLALWEYYTIQGLTHSHKIPHIFLSYKDLIKKLDKVIRKFSKSLNHFGMPVSKISTASMQESLKPYPEDQERVTEMHQIMTSAQVRLHKMLKKGNQDHRLPALSNNVASRLAAFEKQINENEQHIKITWELSLLKNQLQKDKEQVTKLDNHLTEMIGTGDSVKEENDNLQKQVTKLDNHLTEMIRTADSVKEENDNLQKQIGTLSSEIENYQNQVYRLTRWMEKLYSDIDTLFNSVSWKLGRWFISMACYLTFRKPGDTIKVHIDAIMSDFNIWRDNKKRNRENAG